MYIIIKYKNAADCLKRNTLLEACINDKGDIFKEIKKLRKSSSVVATLIDGNAENI